MNTKPYNRRVYQRDYYRRKAIEKKNDKLKFAPTFALELDFSARLQQHILSEKSRLDVMNANNEIKYKLPKKNFLPRVALTEYDFSTRLKFELNK